MSRPNRARATSGDFPYRGHTLRSLLATDAVAILRGDHRIGFAPDTEAARAEVDALLNPEHGPDFDRAEADYAFCALRHRGQGCPRYAELSASPFRPGALWSESRFLATDSPARELYLERCEREGVEPGTLAR